MKLAKQVLVALGSSLFILPAGLAKNTQFQLPACDAVINSTNDVEQAKLVPIKLDNNAEHGTTDGVSSVNRRILESGLHVGPLAIIPSKQEDETKSETTSSAERRQLTGLWNAAVSQSPDIQFVINALFPTSEAGHAKATMMKSIGAALFSVAQAAPILVGPGLKSLPIGAGANIINDLFNRQTAKDAQRQNISQEQAVMLYKIVRDTADKLVLEYRQYKRSQSNLTRAYHNSQDLQAMAAAILPTLNPLEQFQLHYTLSCAERDRDNAEDEIRMHQNQLFDLAGGEAVAKLNSQIYEEQMVLNNLTGGKVFDAALEVRPEGTATAKQAPAADNE